MTRPSPGGRPRGAGVIGHRADAKADETVLIEGVLTSTPARTWLELASLLTVDELIILGDHLVRVPRVRFENRSTAIRACRVSHVLGRPSPSSEWARTHRWRPKLRLAIVRAGLPEPELQIALDPRDPYSQHADLGYRAPRIAVQYDGGVHLTPEQQSRDNRRDTTFSL